MTFVQDPTGLDRMAAGARHLLVHLRGEEPLRNVPRTAREQGHEYWLRTLMPPGSATC